MKRLLPLLTLLLLSSLHAEQIGFWKVQKVKSNDSLNIREMATHKSNKVSAIAHNAQCIKNHGCGKDIDLDSMMNMTEDQVKDFLSQAKDGWCYIEHQGHTGWVNQYYLKESKEECK